MYLSLAIVMKVAVSGLSAIGSIVGKAPLDV
jgi:hypothetical protein